MTRNILDFITDVIKEKKAILTKEFKDQPEKKKALFAKLEQCFDEQNSNFKFFKNFNEIQDDDAINAYILLSIVEAIRDANGNYKKIDKDNISLGEVNSSLLYKLISYYGCSEKHQGSLKNNFITSFQTVKYIEFKDIDKAISCDLPVNNTDIDIKEWRDAILKKPNHYIELFGQANEININRLEAVQNNLSCDTINIDNAEKKLDYYSPKYFNRLKIKIKGKSDEQIKNIIQPLKNFTQLELKYCVYIDFCDPDLYNKFFDSYLEKLMNYSKFKTTEELPKVAMHYGKYHLINLPIADPHMYFFGEIVGNCYSGKPTNHYIANNQKCGAYVLLEEKNLLDGKNPNPENTTNLDRGIINYNNFNIKGYGVAFLNQYNNLTFTSWENSDANIEGQPHNHAIVQILQQFAMDVPILYPDISKIFIGGGTNARTPRELTPNKDMLYPYDFGYGSSAQYLWFLNACQTDAKSSRLNDVESNFTKNLDDLGAEDFLHHQPQDEVGQIQENHDQAEYLANENHEPVEASGSSLIDNNNNIIYD